MGLNNAIHERINQNLNLINGKRKPRNHYCFLCTIFSRAAPQLPCKKKLASLCIHIWNRLVRGAGEDNAVQITINLQGMAVTVMLCREK